MLGDFEFVGGAALGFLSSGDHAALRFHSVGELIETDQRKGVAVDIAEAGDDSAPDRRFFAEEHAAAAGDGFCALTCGCRCGSLRRLKLVADALEARRCLEAHAALRPFLEFSGDVFGDKDDLRGSTDEFVLLGVGLGNDERQDGGAIRRGHADPALAGLHARVKGDVEAELVDEKAEAAVLVADEYVDAMEAQVGGLAERGRDGGHGRDYKAERMVVDRRMSAQPKNGCATKGADCFEGERVRKWRTRNYEHITGQACHADQAG